jgi:hypothetical protein
MCAKAPAESPFASVVTGDSKRVDCAVVPPAEPAREMRTEVIALHGGESSQLQSADSVDGKGRSPRACPA